MKATRLLLLFAMVLSMAFMASAQHRTVLGEFKLGADTYSQLKQKFVKTHTIATSDDTIKIANPVHSVVELKDIAVENYYYKGNCGLLELFFGKDVLYAVRFTQGSCNDIEMNTSYYIAYFYYDKPMWKRYKKYWNAF